MLEYSSYAAFVVLVLITSVLITLLGMLIVTILPLVYVRLGANRKPGTEVNVKELEDKIYTKAKIIIPLFVIIWVIGFTFYSFETEGPNRHSEYTIKTYIETIEKLEVTDRNVVLATEESVLVGSHDAFAYNVGDKLVVQKLISPSGNETAELVCSYDELLEYASAPANLYALYIYDESCRVHLTVPTKLKFHADSAEIVSQFSGRTYNLLSHGYSGFGGVTFKDCRVQLIVDELNDNEISLSFKLIK